MSAVYSGRWPWPVAECTHPDDLRADGHDIADHEGLLRRLPAYCRGCGYTFGPPTTTEGTNG